MIQTVYLVNLTLLIQVILIKSEFFMNIYSSLILNIRNFTLKESPSFSLSLSLSLSYYDDSPRKITWVNATW